MKYRAVPAAFFATVIAIGVAHAAISQPVYKAFRGRILVTEQPLPDHTGDAKETTRHYKQLHRNTIPATKDGDEHAWEFHYTAFLRSPARRGDASIDVYGPGGKYVTTKALPGIDRNAVVLMGTATFTDSEGIVAGTLYELRLVVQKSGKDKTLAVTRLRLK